MKTKKHCIKKAVLSLLLSGACLLSACNKTADTQSKTNQITSKSVTEVVNAIIASQSDLTNTKVTESSSDDFSDLMETRYAITTDSKKVDGTIAYSTEASADEIAVFHILSDDSDNALSPFALSETLKTYINDRSVAFNGYAPYEVAKLQKSTIVTNGDYVALLICNDTAAAKKAFDACFSDSSASSELTASNPDDSNTTASDPNTSNSTDSGNSVAIIGGSDGPTSVFIAGKDSDSNGVTDVPAADGANSKEDDSNKDAGSNKDADSSESNKEDTAVDSKDAIIIGDFAVTKELSNVAVNMYDNSAIVAAYKANDVSLLSDSKQIEIYNKCVEVIKERITDDMTDLEKETAIHDFMVSYGDYDQQALANEETPSEDANNPYGFLIHQYGICSGYTTTFQLFMDLLDIPCLSIAGSSVMTSNGHEEDHAWNMACIDDTWYYVDVTWDDPIGNYDSNISHMFLNCTTTIMVMTGHSWNRDSYPSVSNYAK